MMSRRSLEVAPAQVCDSTLAGDDLWSKVLVPGPLVRDRLVHPEVLAAHDPTT
jgi:hypothetical protein